MPPKRKSDSTDTLIEQLREYEVLKVLGKGGMGIVYLVRHSLTKRIEVLKVLRPSLASRTKLKERFLREVQVAAKLDHPHVVKTLTAIQTDKVVGLVMEYVDGQDLDSWVRHSGPLPVWIATTVIRQAALGLHHAHQHGLIHRDIKPSNILISQTSDSPIAKLSDFGLSKLDDEVPTNNLTMDGRFLGTPDYMAPEQCLDAASATVAADIYGLGCTLYYALVGRPPYAGANAMAVLNMHINAPIPNAAALRPDLPDGLSHILHSMLQKDPRTRCGSAADVAHALLPYTGLSHTSLTTTSNTSTNNHTTNPNTTSDSAAVAPASMASNSRVEADTSNQWNSALVSNRPLRKRQAQKSKPIWPVLLQVAMPIGFLFAAIYLIRPWLGSTDGTLRILNLPVGHTVLIDGTIQIAAAPDRPFTEIRLPAGEHRILVSDGAGNYLDRTVDIKANGLLELSLAKNGQSQSSPPTPPPKPPKIPPNPKRSNQETNRAPEVVEPRQPELQMPLVEPQPIPKDSNASATNSPTRTPVTIPKTSLEHPAFTIELERQFSGLSWRPSGLTLLPRGLTSEGNEIVVATGSQPKAWDAKTGFPQEFSTPFTLSGLAIASNEKSVLYFDDYKCEVWVFRKPQPTKWFWTPQNLDVKRVFAISSDSKYLACVDHNESFIRWELSSNRIIAI